MAATFDLSRDHLDGLLLQQPQIRPDKGEIKASANVHFLPSSPDRTMHTAIVSLTLQLDGQQHPFVQGAWRFLFTSDAAAEPKDQAEHPFFAQLMAVGMGKLMVQINNLCMHANLPLVPFEPGRMVRQARAQQQGAPPPATGAAGAAP